MNYIRHLNAFFSVVRSDNRLTSSHVSLYLALFQYWNFNRFQNPFPVFRDNIMQLSKIGSKNTYHKCIKQLHLANYILYHPAVSKFQPVHISIIRLDLKQQPSTFKQLDMFSIPPSPQGEGSGVRSGIKSDTHTVPNLTPTSTDNDTDTVPNMGQYIKPNNKQRETPSQNIFKKGNKTANTKTNDSRVSNLIHDDVCHTEQSEVSQTLKPKYSIVEKYFLENNHPPTEAKKFYNHYKALGWKIQGVTPIEDWKALVEKWMANAAKWDSSSLRGGTTKQTAEREKDLHYLYESYLDGKKIYHHITTNHFHQLKLEITEEIIQQAWQQRINLVTGTNQHSVIELWKAYLTNNPDHPLIQKDKPNLIAIAKRISVLNHFHQLKQSGTKTIPP